LAAGSPRWGRVDVLVNNAGIFWAHRGDTLVTEMDEAVWTHVLAVNLTGVFLCCKCGIPAMGRGGSIVNIASIAGLLGRDTVQAYVAAKGGVLALTRSLAVHYAARGIRANAILPGRVDTPLVVDDYATPEERAAFARPPARPLWDARGYRGVGPVPGLGRGGLGDRRLVRHRWRLYRAVIPLGGPSRGGFSPRLSNVDNTAVASVARVLVRCGERRGMCPYVLRVPRVPRVPRRCDSVVRGR